MIVRVFSLARSDPGIRIRTRLIDKKNLINLIDVSFNIRSYYLYSLLYG